LFVELPIAAASGALRPPATKSAVSRAGRSFRRFAGAKPIRLDDFFARLDVGDAVAERLIDLPGRLPAMRDCVAMMELPDAVPEGQWEHPCACEF